MVVSKQNNCTLSKPLAQIFSLFGRIGLLRARGSPRSRGTERIARSKLLARSRDDSGCPLKTLLYGRGSKNRYQHGALVSGNMDQNLRNPSCFILSHTHIGLKELEWDPGILDSHCLRHRGDHVRKKSQLLKLQDPGRKTTAPQVLQH